ncbi:uncharacterized protein LOC124353372 [Homalodisca vitripennis]|uniref:uncharacterized protein LOC124353372 n=1 Tax=Homalodisca vitripennis TaxID=197043 RepID=UPI001EEC76C1|nr:uncharacterized protein LOC124353372 [Homalodisca vitripennis]
MPLVGMDMIKIYYDDDNKPVPMLTNISDVVPTLKAPNVRFGPLPCNCADLTCGCCVNMNIQLFNFQRRACTNFTYDPYEFSIGMNLLWNDESIYKTSVSGKNPPPICIQAPIPYLPTMDQCVRIFNIFTPGRNIHMCMNLETRFERVPVLVLQFDCMRMGADGVALLKPEAEGGLTPPMEEEEEEEETEETEEKPPQTTQEAANIFDPVDPDKKKLNRTIGQMQGNGHVIITITEDENLNSNKTSETGNAENKNSTGTFEEITTSNKTLPLNMTRTYDNKENVKKKVEKRQKNYT